MLLVQGAYWEVCLCWLLVPGPRSTSGLNATQGHPHQLVCRPGHYCPEGGETVVPCPRGTFGPGFWATDVRDCVSCPPHHYSPREGLSSCLACGSRAWQPLPGQDRCVCLGEGQVFQASDGQCHCALGYRTTRRGDGCELMVYEICRDGKVRDQRGQCLSSRQWEQHCSRQVCVSPDHYEGYDGSLGLCVCRGPPEPARAECVGWCADTPAPALQVVCSAGVLRLIYTASDTQVITSESVLLSVFNRWDSEGTLKCDGSLGFSRPVYVVEAREAGLFGLLHTVPADVRTLVLENGQEAPSAVTASRAHGSVDVEFGGNHTHMEMNSHWSADSALRGVKNRGVVGVLNPTACLHPNDILLFTGTRQHYPQYDVENLFNTNAAFDWGPFRLLARDRIMAPPAQSLFSVSFSEPGVYVLTLSSNNHKHMYVKILPAGAECYDPGPFFPADPHHMTRMGIARRRQLLLRPDWLTVRGLLAGVVVLLCLCVVLLVLFREHGWPDKLPAHARFRALQLKYNMDDYSSKGSRVMMVKKTHRNLQAGLMEDSAQRALAVMPDEFWDYEEQVDLEAFSSSTFYDILLKHSFSVTARLGQLKGEVKQLYHNVMRRVEVLHPACGVAAGGKPEGLQGQVEKELARRKALGLQLTQLLDRQLETLRAGLQPQHAMHTAFTAALRECMRLLPTATDSHAPLWDARIQQSVQDRVETLAGEMADLVCAEAQRQGVWTVLRLSTGARLLCPASGVSLTRDDIIAPDGTVRACDIVHVDPCTGLVLPSTKAHMVVASGHSMPVPRDFLLHPQTGRVMPVSGNVAFDPASSTLVCTVDSCVVEDGHWESPLLPYVPYPQSHHSQAPGLSKLRGLRAGQRLVYGGPMWDYDTGVPVPILAVTIHPETGRVYPLGGLHVCPLSRLHLPIQIGGPMLDARTGSLALITGVTLDPLSGAVLPVGGLLLGEPFTEPLSGRQARVGGCSLRGGKLVPHAGGFQALLDSQALGLRARLVEQVRAPGALEGRCAGSGWRVSAVEVEKAWRASQHCALQLLSRLEAQREWAWRVSQDGGSVGLLKLSGADLSLPALPGMEYPDPGGSGLLVPVLGAQLDWVSGCTVPLAGTMEDPDGKGLVPIRLGAQTVDPMTGVLAPVVGARLDMWSRTVVPVTASQCSAVGETPDCVLVEAMQEECRVRERFWRDQTEREDELLADLDRTLRSVNSDPPEHTEHLVWTDLECELNEVIVDIEEAVHTEAQRRRSQSSELSLVLSPHVLHTLSTGDEDEWEQQSRWHAELMSVLNRVSVCMAQRKQNQPTLLEDEPDTSGSQRALWELVSLSDLDAALAAVRWARDLGRLGADTAQAMVSGSFWYRDYGWSGWRRPAGRSPMKAVAMTQQKLLPRLERLARLLEEGQIQGLSAGPQRLHSSDLSALQVRVTCSRTLAVSVPVNEVLSLRDQQKPSTMRERDVKVPLSSMSPSERTEDKTLPHSLAREWAELLELSPLFGLIKGVEQQLRDHAHHAGLLDGRSSGSGRPFMDFLDAQWECEGCLVQVTPGALSPRELLSYRQGQRLLQLLHTHKLAPAVTLLLASSLPVNDYHGNAFRHSFFYQETEGTLYVRRQRLQCVGGLSLLLLHCSAHISTGQLGCDSAPAFQRAFFKVLQVSLGELSLSPTTVEGGDLASSVLELDRVQSPSPDILPKTEAARLLRRHRDASARREEGVAHDSGLEVDPRTTHPPLRPSTAPE